MRCPYCAEINQDRAAFCTSCGRDLTRPPKQQTPPPRVTGTQGRSPGPPQPASQPSHAHPPQAGRRQQAASGPAPIHAYAAAPPAPPAPEPPAPFPPHTLEQFHQLLVPGAQAYTVVQSQLGDGRRKQVRIVYPRCTGWQQAATLLKALNEQQDKECSAITVQGMLPGQENLYAFTNGQLQFERNVRLGGQVGNRYVVETENGFASDATRFVLNEY